MEKWIRGAVVTVALGLWSIGSVNATEEVIYYYNDALGSPIMATDESGNVKWREEYAPYGSRLVLQAREDDGGNPPAPVESIWDEKQWFTGKLEETRVGLQYFGARWYEPEIGRFLSPDPVEFQEGNLFSFNRYAYANSNPYRYVDPDGRAPRSTAPGQQSGFANAIGGGASRAGPIMGGGAAGRASSSAPIGRAAGSKAVNNTSSLTKGLPDNAVVCRGGTCTADRFSKGSGVKVDSQGNLSGVSVNSAPGKSVQELSQGIPNKQVGVTTVGDIRQAGGNVTPSPTANNPNHCTMCGISPQKAEELFTPTIKNPNL